MLFVAVLVGAIIWFNAKKTSELMIADAERRMIETGEKVTDRIRLLYDPIYAIVGLGAQVSNLTAPLPPDGSDGPYPALRLMLRGLRTTRRSCRSTSVSRTAISLWSRI